MHIITERTKTLILGALLHDIGKVIQRSEGSVTTHSVLGSKFISDLEMPDKADVACCAAYHHAAELKNSPLEPNDLAWIVYEADNIAAGTDRREVEDYGKGFDKEAPLESVFNLIGSNKGKKAHYLRTLNEKNAINYPLDAAGIRAASSSYFQVLEDIKLATKEIDFYNDSLNSLLNIMEATLSYVPSSTSLSEVPDISLYDHSRLTASIASCIYAYFQEENIEDYRKFCFADNKSFRETDVFMLVSADMSGIQDFIYTIASKGALKSLRARSFYLEIMLEHIADEILEEVGLSRANVLYTGGGHFYLLLPHTKKVVDVLTAAQQKINKWFLKKYSTSLYVEIAYQQCTANDLMNPPDHKGNRSERTRNIFRKLSEKLSRGKLSRYSRDELNDLFDPSSNYNNSPESGSRECTVCHTSSVPYADTHDEITGDICGNCYTLFKLGKIILNRDIVVCVGRQSKGLSLEAPSIDGSDVFFSFLRGVEAEESLKQEKEIFRRVYVKNGYYSGISVSVPLWMGDYHAQAEQEQSGLIEFAELAGRSAGINRLAVLRADVDNLGKIFVAGFDQVGGDPCRYDTISRKAALSRQLSLFFKRYINLIAGSSLKGEGNVSFLPFTLSEEKNKDGQGRNLVIVYSGGDDVFIVGAWDEVLCFAMDLKKAFDLFTGGKLTFSAGIAFFHHDFPISQMARMAGMLESAAKAHPKDEDEKLKDAIALFGIDESDAERTVQHVYSWSDFIDRIWSKKLLLMQDIFDFSDEKATPGKLPAGMSFLYRMLTLYGGKSAEGVNLPHLAYALARMEPKELKKNTDDPVTEQLRIRYSKARKYMYEWALTEHDCQEMLTVINLLIYANRKKRDKEE